MPNWDNTERIRLLNGHYIRLPANLGVRVYASQSQSIPDVTWTPIDFDAERWDTGITNDYANGFWDAGVSQARLTATKAGFYDINGCVEFASDNAGRREARISHTSLVPATTVIERDGRPSVQGAVTAISISTKWWMNVGEYVTFDVYQSSGGALNANRAANYSPEFAMVRIP